MSLPLPLGLTLKRKPNISAPVLKIMIDHLRNKNKVYGKKGEKSHYFFNCHQEKMLFLIP